MLFVWFCKVVIALILYLICKSVIKSNKDDRVRVSCFLHWLAHAINEKLIYTYLPQVISYSCSSCTTRWYLSGYQKVIFWNFQMNFTINQHWDGKSTGHDPIKVTLTSGGNGIRMMVEGPFFNDPPSLPSAPGEPAAQLWDYEGKRNLNNTSLMFHF